MKKNTFYFLSFAPIFFSAYTLRLFNTDMKILIIIGIYIYELIIVLLRDKYVGNKSILSDFMNWENRKKRIINRLFHE